jgi:mono/diheme cytochrome c family protein
MTGDRTRRLLLGWVLGVATCALIAAMILVLILSGIIFNTSATQPHSKALAWGVHMTMINSVTRRSRGNVPTLPLTRETLMAGARQYEAHCIACHGGPGVARAQWASGMLPSPPYLIDASSRWSHAQLYNLVHDGVKMTGMPAWGEVESDRQVAEVVAFLEVMPKMTPDQFGRLRQRIRVELNEPQSARGTP